MVRIRFLLGRRVAQLSPWGRRVWSGVVALGRIVVPVAALGGLFIAIQGARDSADALDAAQRSADAQTQPLLIGIPLGARLNPPLLVEASRITRVVRHPGEVILDPASGRFPPRSPRVINWLLSVPLHNDGSGIARITGASFSSPAAPLKDVSYPVFVAQKEDHRLTSIVRARLVDDVQGFVVRYEDLATRTCWATSLALLLRPNGRELSAFVVGTATRQRPC